MSIVKVMFLHDRVLRRAFEMLELHAWEHARAVLRGGGGSNVVSLPDYLYEYEDLCEARTRIGHFLESVYNQKRLHSALGYLPPTEFEQALHHSTLA